MTGPDGELRPGDRVIWRHEHRGGYGYVTRVPATVVKVGPRLVRIEIERASDGTHVFRWVTPDRLEQGG